MPETVIHLKLDLDLKNAFDEKSRSSYNMKPSDLLRMMMEALSEDRLKIVPNETQKNLHLNLFTIEGDN